MTDWIDMFRMGKGLAGRDFRVSDLEELGAIAKKYTKKEIILKVSKEAILTAPVGDLQLVE